MGLFLHVEYHFLTDTVFQETLYNALLQLFHFVLKNLHLPLQLSDSVGFQSQLSLERVNLMFIL
jgi:hypothetical protein